LIWPSSVNLKRLGATSKVTPLHVAAWSGLVGYSRLLIKDGTQTHCFDGQHMTPLSWAALNGHDDVVALLIQHDPQDNYESPTYFHQTPLHFAARENHHAIVQQLLVAGADPLTKRFKTSRLRSDRRYWR
jgi:ankyrin repeat protein